MNELSCSNSIRNNDNDNELMSLLRLEDFGEDILAIILSYLDLTSAIRWKDSVHSSWKLRLTLSYLQHVWKQFFDQQGFSRQDDVVVQGSSVSTIIILQQLKYRTLLQKTLWGRRHRRKSNSNKYNSFPIPNRLFSFLPILPDDDDNDEPETVWWNDPPPVHFACDSFVLTSTAVGSEFLLLNPFSHSLSLYTSILDNAVHSDEGMMEQAMQHAAGCFISHPLSLSLASSCTTTSAQSTPLHSPPADPIAVTRNSNNNNVWRPDPQEAEQIELAAVVFEDRVRRNHSLYNRTYHKDPHHVLISYQDTVLDEDWMNYFWEHAPQRRSSAQHQQQRRFFPMDDNDEEDNEEESGEIHVEISYIGVDAKPVLTIDHNEDARPTVPTTMLSVGRALSTESSHRDDSIVECFEIMSWFRQANQTQSQWICRVRGDFQWVELCANHKWVYLNPSMANGDQLIREWNQPLGNSNVLVYPMVEYRSLEDNDGVDDPSRYFPIPKFVLNCQHRVSSLGVCASGKHLIVATLPARLIFWNTQMGTTPVRVQEIDSGKVVPCAAEVPIQSIHVPKAASIEERGFCTMHKSQVHGHTLLVWHYGVHADTENSHQFQSHTTIHLPLSAQRIPQVHYDGRRLIVFGQDHISLIILVYEVITLIDHPVHKDDCTGEQLDGGVSDLGAPGTGPRVRFVNRIRHAALGGVEDYESLKMTCNERFVVVNTKTGNLLSDGAIPFHEGLLIIDLDDDHQHRSFEY